MVITDTALDSLLDDVLTRLKALGSDQNIKIMLAFGLRPDGQYWGVKHTSMSSLAKDIKPNNVLAQALWQLPIHDAKLFACYLQETKKVTLQQVLSQLPDINSFDIADRYAQQVLWPTGLYIDVLSNLYGSSNANLRCCAYSILRLQAKDKKMEDQYFFGFIRLITDTINTEDNWVREMQNYCMLVIGKRSDILRNAVLEAFLKIGKITLDYGTSTCKTTDVSALLKSKVGS